MRATRAIIRIDHLRHNLACIKSHTGGGRDICLAVKADAYGHGITDVGLAAQAWGVNYLAVATTDEAVELREVGVSLPIMLYSLPIPEELPEIVAQGITPMIADMEMVRQLGAEADRQSQVTPVHLKIDTGMGRIGCRPEAAASIAREITRVGSLRLCGISTHFAGSDIEDPEFTELQMSRFEQALKAIRSAGINPGVVHASNSGAIIAHPGSWYDLVRPGILAYGYYPSDQQPRDLAVRPVMELESQVVFIKEIAAGDTVSYGMTWRARRATHIGTIPIGYGDGYSRLLSNQGQVWIGGTIYPVVGRVCMDQIMVDLGPVCTVHRYDRAVLFGYTDGAPTAETLASMCQTIPYEVTCAVSRRVPRIYVESDDSANN